MAGSLEAFRSREPYFKTEDHLLNYALRKVAATGLDRYLARIWTAGTYRRVSASVGDLVLWHLPAEKGRGFCKPARAACDGRSAFWGGSQIQVQALIGHAVGGTVRSARRVLEDVLATTTKRVVGRL